MFKVQQYRTQKEQLTATLILPKK